MFRYGDETNRAGKQELKEGQKEAAAEDRTLTGRAEALQTTNKIIKKEGWLSWLCGLGCSADKTERECRFENKGVEIHK